VSLEFPDTVLYCGDGFVDHCDELANLGFGSSLKEINGSNHFYYCRKLVQLYFPDSFERIRTQIFTSSYIRSISLPGNLDYVHPNAFFCEGVAEDDGCERGLHLRGPTISESLCSALGSLPDGSHVFVSNVEGTTICGDRPFNPEDPVVVPATHAPRPPPATQIPTRTFAKTPAADAVGRYLNLSENAPTNPVLDPSEPLHLSGSGTLGSDGDSIYLSVVVLEPGAEVIATGLVIQNELELKGNSGLAASSGDHIELVPDVKLQFVAEGGKAPRGLWLGDIGTEYDVLPSIVSVEIGQLTD
jgi:hypothetical protein